MTKKPDDGFPLREALSGLCYYLMVMSKKVGDQTKATPKIKEIAESLEKEGLEYVFEAMKWVNRELEYKFDSKVFRTRSADRIVSDGFHTGCTDVCLVFIALCNYKRMNPIYMEAIERQWLQDPKDKIMGHVFVKIHVNGIEYFTDPANMAVYPRIPPAIRNKYRIYAEGLDSWDVGIKSFEDLREKFMEFSSAFRN